MSDEIIATVALRSMEKLDSDQMGFIRGKRWTSPAGHRFTRIANLVHITIAPSAMSDFESILQVDGYVKSDVTFEYSIGSKFYIVNREDISPWIDLWESDDIQLGGLSGKEIVNLATKEVVQSGDENIVDRIQKLRAEFALSTDSTSTIRQKIADKNESIDLLEGKLKFILDALKSESNEIINTNNYGICHMYHNGEVVAYGRDYGPLVVYGGHVYPKIKVGDGVKLMSIDVDDGINQPQRHLSKEYCQGYERIHGGTMLPSGHWIQIVDGALKVHLHMYRPVGPDSDGKSTIEINKGFPFTLDRQPWKGHLLIIDKQTIPINLRTGKVTVPAIETTHANHIDHDFDMSPWLNAYRLISGRIKELEIEKKEIIFNLGEMEAKRDECELACTKVLSEYISKCRAGRNLTFNLDGSIGQLSIYGDIYLDGYYAYVNTPSYGMEVLCHSPEGLRELSHNGGPTLKDLIDHWEQ